MRKRIATFGTAVMMMLGLLFIPAHAQAAVPIPQQLYCYGNGAGYGYEVGIGIHLNGYPLGTYQAIVNPHVAACQSYGQLIGIMVGPGWCID